MRFGMGHGAWAGRARQGFDRGRGDEGERGGRRGRVFDGGELRLVLLRLIADEPRHGYDLIREIEARAGGGYAPSPGVVYPTLTLLDEMGLIAEQQSEGTKKRFAVTEAGERQLYDERVAVEALFARLAELGARRERTDGAPIRRAMGNLRAVLGNRLSGDEVDLDTLHAVAALIDEAAQKIERLK